jgi:ribosomal protein S24E
MAVAEVRKAGLKTLRENVDILQRTPYDFTVMHMAAPLPERSSVRARHRFR